jgi:transposase
MIKLTFSSKEIEALETERYTHPHPKVQRKMEALYLKSLNLEHNLICKICRIKEPTLVRYFRIYETKGIAGLKQLGYAGQPSKLRCHQDSLEEHFRKHPPATSAEAQSAIEKITGVRRSPTQVREFLHRLGMKHRKTGFVPGPSDRPEKKAEQAAYLKKTSNPNWRKLKQVGGWSFSWMPLILSIRLIWDSCGVSSGFS